MTRGLLALFQRSLREDARHPLSYAIRAVLAATILVCLWATTMGTGWRGAPGREFLEVVMTVNLVFINLAGLSYFAAAIAEEKEEMTLGLLRMTSLSPLSILLGKSASRVCGALLMLLAQFPFTLLAVALGGVGINQVVAAYGTLISYVLFLGNVALFFSTATSRTVVAATLTGLWMALFFFSPGISTAIINELVSTGTLSQSGWVAISVKAGGNFLTDASPFHHLATIMKTGFAESPLGFQVLSNVGLGGLFFVLSWATFNLFCREQKDAAPGRGWLTGAKSRGRLFRVDRPWGNALAWKEFYFHAGGKLGLVAKILVLGFPVGIMVLVAKLGRHPIKSSEIGAVLMWWTLVWTVIEAGFESSRLFRHERRWKTLSSVIILPNSVGRFAYSKLAGFLIALIPNAMAFVLGVWLAPVVVRDILRTVFEHSEAFVISCFLLSLTVFFVHLTAYLSLWLRRGALPVSIAITLVGNWIAVMILMFGTGQTGSLVLLVLVHVVVSFILHFSIASRLEQVAAED